LKIAYRHVNPHFDVRSNQIVKDTIEGVTIKSFIDKNNLDTELITTNWLIGQLAWWDRDETVEKVM